MISYDVFCLRVLENTNDENIEEINNHLAEVLVVEADLKYWRSIKDYEKYKSQQNRLDKVYTKIAKITGVHR